MKYWSQNAFLEMRFDIRPGLPNDPEGMKTGTNLWCHVYNSRQKVRTLLGNRSRGFIWFFSFLAWYSQHKRKGIPLILLLDEPALFLHGTAQKDLLRYLEDESKTGQPGDLHNTVPVHDRCPPVRQGAHCRRQGRRRGRSFLHPPGWARGSARTPRIPRREASFRSAGRLQTDCLPIFFRRTTS